MHQPWRLFAAIISRCLSGKTIGLDSLCLSRAQIIWGMYHKKNVDYVYLLWKDLLYGAILSDELINHEIKDSEAYKQYYAVASRAEPPNDEDDDDEVCISKDNDDNDKNADDANQHTESDIDGDDFVHLRFSTHDEEVRQDEEDKEEEGSDLRVQITSHYESTNDEVSDEVTQGGNVEGEELDKE
ncbi:hypothetical protein Tco_1346937 [Tanacetum coccineum]